MFKKRICHRYFQNFGKFCHARTMCQNYFIDIISMTLVVCQEIVCFEASSGGALKNILLSKIPRKALVEVLLEVLLVLRPYRNLHQEVLILQNKGMGAV